MKPVKKQGFRFRPRKMKRVQMTVLKSDVNTVIEYLGRNEAMHFGSSDEIKESPGFLHVKSLLERMQGCCKFLEIELPEEVETDAKLPGDEEENLAVKICEAVDLLAEKENAVRLDKQRVEEALREAKAFSNLNAPFAELDQLSYLTMRIGRLDPKSQAEIRGRLGDRAVIISLGEGGGSRILAASSRKGRFALDSELKKYSFEKITVPENYKGVPAELLEGLEKRLKEAVQNGRVRWVQFNI